jgi:predicted Ser/Thr protein kinase
MIGETIGHYRVTDKLGSGGMGVVYAAEDTRLGREVALKFLPEDIVRDATALERFRLEARATSSLNHPHICTVYDIGEHEGHPFIVMELLRGQTLAERRVDRARRLEDALELGCQIADALEAAHARGVVHRDIKPANIFVTERGQVKILDFGIAKVAPSTPPESHELATRPVHRSQLTSPGTTLGTIAYMSPEQIGGEGVDARSDLYSFGVVLFELATGKAPFGDKTGAALLQAILVEPPPSPLELNGDLPEDLERILLKALDKDRSMRYQTAADFRADLTRLKRATETRPVAARTAGAAAQRRVPPLRLIHPWEAVARDGRTFAETGAGIMYWFRVPLGGVCYPEGFRNFLQPALENPRISKIRFVLDASIPRTRETWHQLVQPLLRSWASRAGRVFAEEVGGDEGKFLEETTGKSLAWVFVDLSAEFSPCFKLFVNDLDADHAGPAQAQIFLATATRNARLGDGTPHTIRIPDMILRAASPDDDELLRALSQTASQWDFLF